MGNFRNKLKENFSTIPNELLFDCELSIGARFTYCIMASKPENWEFYTKTLASDIGCCVDTLYGFINELVAKGWLVKGRQKNDGRFGSVEYTLMEKATVSENPRDGKIPCRKNSVTENFRDGKFPTQNNKDIISNTEEKNNKKDIDQSKIDLSESASGTPTTASDIDYRKLVDYFNATTKGVFGTIRYPLGENRRKMLRARLREYGKRSFVEVVEKAMASDFLKGQTGWKASFDWLIKPTNYEKVLSGNYDNDSNDGSKRSNNPSLNPIVKDGRLVNSYKGMVADDPTILDKMGYPPIGYEDVVDGRRVKIYIYQH